MSKQNYILLLDGTKGAGKTTLCNVLKEKLNNVVFLSLDDERRSLENQQSDRTKKNKQAFEIILNKAKSSLDEKVNVVIDCGLTDERVKRLKELAKNSKTKTYKFLLKASYEILLDRVRQRDRSKNNNTDEARFKEVYDIVHNKNFDGFIIVDTNELTPNEVAEKVIKNMAF